VSRTQKSNSICLNGEEFVLPPSIKVLESDGSTKLEILTPRGPVTLEKRTVDLHDYHVDGSWKSIFFTAWVGIVGIIVLIWPPRNSYYTGVVLIALCLLRLWEISKICGPRWPTIEILTPADEEQYLAADAWNDPDSCCPMFWAGMMMWALPAKVFGSLMIALLLEWIFNEYRIFVISEYVGSVAACLITIYVEHFASWTQHFSGHKVPFFWKYIHQLHHAPSRYNVWLSLWHHPYELCAFGCKHWFVSILCFGLSKHELFWTVVIVNIQGWLVHANIRTPWLLGFITTRPESHVIHHEEPYPRPENFQRKNFSDCPIWDYLFGTFENPREDPRENPELKIGYSQKTNIWIQQMFGCVDIKEMREKDFFQYPGSPTSVQTMNKIAQSIRSNSAFSFHDVELVISPEKDVAEDTKTEIQQSVGTSI